MISLITFSIIIISVLWFILDRTRIISTILITFGLLAWIPIRISGRTIKSAGADIIFGIVDTSLLGVVALIDARYEGILVAIVGGAVGDAITDGFAGISHLRATIMCSKKSGQCLKLNNLAFSSIGTKF